MDDNNIKPKIDRIYIRLGILLTGLLILAFVDVIVIEKVYKQIAERYAIPWNELEIKVPLFNGEGRMLFWHVAFVPLGFVLFALVGVSGRDWRLTFAGIVLFMTGWEDIAYYIVQFELVPYHLPWLDKSPPIAWTCILTGSAHVTRPDLFIAAGVGGILVGAILRIDKRKRIKGR